MAAITRWTSYSVGSQGEYGDGNGSGCKGTRAYCMATSSVGDVFTIGPTTDRLYISIDGDAGPYITMYQGTDLDPRFVAKDITEKMQSLGKSNPRWDHAVCEWVNDKIYGNCFKIFSGTLGSSSSVIVSTGTNSGAGLLGFNTKVEQGGLSDTNGFGGDVTIAGTYYGFLDEIYKVVISSDSFSESVTAARGIATPVKGGSNSYGGSMTTGGVFNAASNIVYTLSIDVTNGTTLGAHTGNVPRLSWTSTGSDSSTNYTELLYPNHWYKVGDFGLMVKFTDAVFNQCSPAWTIGCYKPDYVEGTNATGPVGVAKYVWSSSRGDVSSSAITTSSGGGTQLGSRGLTIKFNPSGAGDNFSAGDEFYVICKAPKPSSYNITSLNYGNVTVSTESDVKCILFEIQSGAVEMSTVKFGLQSHGTFNHHQSGNNDTFFRFGTVGPANFTGSSPTMGIEWYPNVVPGDISNDIPPAYLFHTRANLPVVSTADNSEMVGNKGLMSDPMWVNIRLGSAETGNNSTINLRLFFDYS